MSITGTEKSWQLSPTSRAIETGVRQTWPQYFPKLPCNMDNFKPSKPSGERESTAGKQRRSDKGEAAYPEEARESGSRDASRRDDRGPLENPTKVVMRTVARSRSRSPRSPRLGGGRTPRETRKAAGR